MFEDSAAVSLTDGHSFLLRRGEKETAYLGRFATTPQIAGAPQVESYLGIQRRDTQERTQPSARALNGLPRQIDP